MATRVQQAHAAQLARLKALYPARPVRDRHGDVYYVTPRGYVTGWEAPGRMHWTSYRVTPGMHPAYWDGGSYDTLLEALIDL